MSDRYKYAKNGIYKCENFAQQVEQNRFPEIDIGSMGRMSRWWLKFTLITKNNQAFLCPAIFCDHKPKVRLRTFFNVLKKDGSPGPGKVICWWTWNLNTYKSLREHFDVSKLFNPENEYLDDDGSISIEYGFHINAIAIKYGIWGFNFHDIVFNYTGEKNQMVICTHQTERCNRLKFYCSPEILNFHCPQFFQQAREFVVRWVYIHKFSQCLQILHGVRLQPDYFGYFEILKLAKSFNLWNVIRYCDQHYKKEVYRSPSTRFHRFVRFNLRLTIAEKLRNLEWKAVVEIARELDFEEASGEVMKTFVAKILHNCQ